MQAALQDWWQKAKKWEMKIAECGEFFVEIRQVCKTGCGPSYWFHSNDRKHLEQQIGYNTTIASLEVLYLNEKPDIYKIGTLYFYHKDQKTVLTKLAKHIGEQFNYPIIYAVYSTTAYFNRPLYAWIIQKFKGKVKSKSIKSDASYDAMKFLLDISKTADSFTFEDKQNQDFHYKFRECSKHFIIENSQWITLPNLIQLCSLSIVVEMCNTSLSSVDLRYFLKMWISSDSSLSIRRLKVKSSIIQENLIMLRVNAIQRDPNHVEIFDELSNKKYEVRGGYDIHRENGGKATIVFSSDHKALTMEIFFWPS